ncbi:hypothetical protein HDU93_006853 [Gonapodya sp. JEL0774]|nr:hypothetical protein HDU93_006853 [Gonapodya sp. JEL0774]
MSSPSIFSLPRHNALISPLLAPSLVRHASSTGQSSRSPRVPLNQPATRRGRRVKENQQGDSLHPDTGAPLDAELVTEAFEITKIVRNSRVRESYRSRDGHNPKAVPAASRQLRTVDTHHLAPTTPSDADLRPSHSLTFRSAGEAVVALLEGVHNRLYNPGAWSNQSSRGYNDSLQADYSPISLDHLWSIYSYVRSKHPEHLAGLPAETWPKIIRAFTPTTRAARVHTGGRAWNSPNYFLAIKRVERIMDDAGEFARLTPTLPEFRASVLVYRPLFRTWEDVQKIFLSRMNAAGVEPDDYIANQILSALAKAYNIVDAQRAWRTFFDSGKLSPDIHSYHAMMQAYLLSPTQALSSLPTLSSQEAPLPGSPTPLHLQHPGYLACLDLYNRILDLFSRKELPHATAPACTLTCNTVLFAAARAGDGAMVDRLWEEMSTVWQVSPDLYSYNALIRHRASTGSVTSVLAILKDLQLRSLRPSQAHLKPNVVTYTAVIKVCLDHGETNKAMELFKEMASVGVYPNIVTYNALVNHLLSKRDADGAEKLIQEMQRKGVSPDVVTFTSMLSLYKTLPSVPLIMATLKRMRDSEIEPNAVSFVSSMDGCRNARSLNGVVSVLRWWGDVSQIEGNQACQTALAMVMSYAGQHDIVRDIWNAKVRAFLTKTPQVVSLPFPGTRPWTIPPATFIPIATTVMLDEVGWNSTVEDLQNVWEQALRCGARLSGNTATSLVEAFARLKDLAGAERVVLVDMKLQGVRPDPKTFGTLIAFARNPSLAVQLEGGLEGLLDRLEQVWPGSVEEGTNSTEEFMSDKLQSEELRQTWTEQFELEEFRAQESETM